MVSLVRFYSQDGPDCAAAERRWDERGAPIPAPKMLPGSQPAQQALDLVASLSALEAPFAKMLAIVPEEMVPILAETGPRAIDDFLGSEPGRHTRSHPYAPPATEALERNLFHRSPGQEPGNGAAMDDLTRTQIDAMVDVSDPGRNEMRTGRGIRVVGHEIVKATWPSCSILITLLRECHLLCLTYADTAMSSSSVVVRRQTPGLMPTTRRNERLRCD